MSKRVLVYLVLLVVLLVMVGCQNPAVMQLTKKMQESVLYLDLSMTDYDALVDKSVYRHEALTEADMTEMARVRRVRDKLRVGLGVAVGIRPVSDAQAALDERWQDVSILTRPEEKVTDANP
jgi:imidazole glycerol phosphate synthase subunit HisF